MRLVKDSRAKADERTKLPSVVIRTVRIEAAERAYLDAYRNSKNLHHNDGTPEYYGAKVWSRKGTVISVSQASIKFGKELCGKQVDI